MLLDFLECLPSTHARQAQIDQNERNRRRMRREHRHRLQPVPRLDHTEAGSFKRSPERLQNGFLVINQQDRELPRGNLRHGNRWQRFRSRLGQCGQIKPENQRHARPCIHFEMSAMAGHDAVHDQHREIATALGEPHGLLPRILIVLLRQFERGGFGAQRQHHIAVVMRIRKLCPQHLAGHRPHVHRHASAHPYHITRLLPQIGQGVVKLLGIDRNRRNLLLDFEGKFYSGRQRFPCHPVKLTHKITRLHPLESEFVPPRKMQRLPDQVGRTTHRMLDALNRSVEPGRIPPRVLQERRIPQDDREKIIKVVADIGRQRGEVLRPLMLPQRPHTLHLPGQINQRRETKHPAVRQTHARIRDMREKRTSALVHVNRARHRRIIAIDEDCVRQRALHGCLGGDERHGGSPYQLIRQPPHRRAKRRVDRHDDTFPIRQAQPQRTTRPKLGQQAAKLGRQVTNLGGLDGKSVRSLAHWAQ